MAKGGARAHSGPAPDPNALRRDRPEDKAGWISLPAEGRSGPPPKWPLPTPASEAEAELWAAEWRTPQATQWEARSMEVEVALYVRTVLEAEQPGAVAALRSEARRQQEAVGRSLAGLARNNWKIAEKPKADEVPRSVARAGFTIIEGGAA